MAPSSLTDRLLGRRVLHQVPQTSCLPELHLQRLLRSSPSNPVRKMICPRSSTHPRKPQTARMAPHQHRVVERTPRVERLHDSNLLPAAKLQSPLPSNTSSSKLKQWPLSSTRWLPTSSNRPILDEALAKKYRNRSRLTTVPQHTYSPRHSSSLHSRWIRRTFLCLHSRDVSGQRLDQGKDQGRVRVPTSWLSSMQFARTQTLRCDTVS